METLAQRQAIRRHYQDGYAKGEAMLESMSAISELERLTAMAQVGKQFRETNGLTHNYHQGTWHAIGDIPLCYVMAAVERGEIEL